MKKKNAEENEVAVADIEYLEVSFSFMCETLCSITPLYIPAMYT